MVKYLVTVMKFSFFPEISDVSGDSVESTWLKKMAAARGEMLDLVLENLGLDEDIEITSDIFIDEEKDGLIL